MKKLLLVSSLILILLFNSTHIYAYWNDSKATYVTDEKPVEVINQSMATSQGKHLVPKGAILGVDDVVEIVFTYQVFVEEDKTLSIDTKNLSIDGVQTPQDISDLFLFTVKQQITKQDSLVMSPFETSKAGTFVDVTLHLSMNMPSDEQYQIIAGGIMNFDVVFEAK